MIFCNWPQVWLQLHDIRLNKKILVFINQLKVVISYWNTPVVYSYNYTITIYNIHVLYTCICTCTYCLPVSSGNQYNNTCTSISYTMYTNMYFKSNISLYVQYNYYENIWNLNLKYWEVKISNRSYMYTMYMYMYMYSNISVVLV